MVRVHIFCSNANGIHTNNSYDNAAFLGAFPTLKLPHNKVTFGVGEDRLQCSSKGNHGSITVFF